MTKKLLGLATMALFCAGMASATTTAFTQCLPGATTNTGGTGTTPGLAGYATCAAWTIPNTDTLTQVNIEVQGDFSAANGTFDFTYTLSTSGGTGTFATTGLTEAIVGSSGNSSAYTWGNTGGTCTNPNTGTNNCDTTMGIAGNGAIQYTSVTVSALGAWVGGSGGFTGNNGSEIFNVFESFTYGPTVTTPEPASLLMIGGGLIGLGVLARRKRRAV